MTYLFRDVLKQNPDKFELHSMVAAYQTIKDKIEKERRPNPEPLIAINKIKYYLPEDLLEIQLKFLIELMNLDLNIETLEGFHMVAACIYREDWSKPFNKKKYIERCEAFYYAPSYYTLQAYRIYEKLILTLKDTYPILYEGDDSVTPDGRRMYDLLDAITKNDITREEIAEAQPIWRAFRWMEDKKIEQLNSKNK